MKKIYLIIISMAITGAAVYSQNSGISMGDATASGAHSFAAGDSVEALGFASLAFGIDVSSEGDYSFAAGNNNRAIGIGASAFGLNTTALGNYSVAMGEGAFAGGYGSIAIGLNANTQGDGFGAVALGTSSSNSPFSLASGINNIAFSGSDGSAVFGGGNHSHAEAVFMAGAENSAFAYAETVVGQFSIPDSFGTSFISTVPTDRLFTIGNGENSSNRSNALVMRKNGDTEMTGNLNIQKRLIIGDDNLAVAGQEGQIRYNSNINDFEGYDGNEWKSLTKSASTPTGSGMVTDVDGNQYLTVRIGTQTWMRENLRTSRFSNGDPINEVLLNTDWSTSDGAWSWYDHDPERDMPYGKLYNWHAAADVRGLCPTGWHVPSDSEWTTLAIALGGAAVAGDKMKTTGTIQEDTGLWQNPNSGATNESGFTGIPGGFRNNDGIFSGVGNNGNWWSSSLSFDLPLFRRLFQDQGNISSEANDRNIGMSVRCVKD